MGHFLSQNPVKGPPYLSPTGVFSKKPTCVCSSALKQQFAGEKPQLLPIMAVPPPQKNRQKCHFPPNRAVFQQKVGGIVIFGRSCNFSPKTPLFNAELQSHVSFFEKTPVGPRFGGVSTPYFSQKSQTSPKSGTKKLKKGGKNLLPKILNTAN